MKLKQFIGYSMVYILLFHLPACTYDYFVDELNYTVHVPEVLDKTVSDCRIMIYNEAGKLVRQATAQHPFDKNPDIIRGNFRFKLPHGNYKVFCYTNTGEVKFEDTHSFANSGFRLKQLTETSHIFQEPSEVFWDNLDREIKVGEHKQTDTVSIHPYIGRIRVIFKNGWESPDIESMDTRVKGVGTRQYLHQINKPGHIYTDDFQVSKDKSLSGTRTTYEFEHFYFPSVEDETMEMEINLFDINGNVVFNIPAFEIKDIDTGTILKLGSGDLIIITIQSNIVIEINLEGWGGIIEDPGGDISA